MIFNSTNKEQNNLLTLAKEILRAEYPRHFLGDDMFIADRNMTFLADEKFVSILNELAKAPMYKGMAWRVHTLVWAIKSVMHLSGDFVECGVFRGFKSHFLCKYFDFETSDKQFWLYDTYEGIAEKYSEGSPIIKEDHNKPKLFEFVQQRFSEYQNVNVVKGIVPDVFEQKLPEEVAYLHLDMNSYQAEIGALEILWDRMPTGAVVILDDYGLYSHRAQQQHEDEWFAMKGQAILELPTAQGVVIKK